MNGTTLGFRRWVWWALAISSSFWSVGTLLYWNRCQGYQVMMNEQPHRRAAVEEAENEPAFYWLEKVLLHGHSIKPSVSSLPTKLDTFREINSYLERMKSAQQRKAEPGDRELMTRLELDPAPSKARTPVDFQLDLHSISLTPGQVCVLNSRTESPGFCKILSSSHSLF
ncbi:uncharacterized protein LOC116593182 isoform X5 [Mustela erminea]|uniref:uncharacterized protein LOC116593182 isoform X5 n=1 Tax=Mustela erminea TaxID=36723 RepID=UPI0013869CF3|nr:uncharacterized protein LOC116593182 isoform X5 [Mustela erminea]